MFSTESNPLENLEVRAETCVESTYEPYLEVQWKEEKDDSIARLSISPPLEEDKTNSESLELSPGFVENHRFFKLVTPGQEYQVEMTKVGIKNIVSVPNMKKVVVPPIEPEEISIGLITQTSVQLKLAAPKTGIFDYFFITVSSAFGKTEHNTTMSDKQFGGQFYTMIFDNLLPGAHYKIKTFTVSNGVRSLAAKVDSCFTLSPTKPVLDRNLLLSGTGGLCVLSFLGNEVKCLSNIRSTTPDEIGAVLYYENWEPVSKVTNKYMIYAKPKDRKILVTGVDGYPHLTLVGDLDMPFGLALDKYGENLYFTDQWTYSIGVASISAALQGSVKATKQILTSNNGIPRFIAVDPIRRLLYWSARDGELESISRSDLNGKRQRMIWFSLGDTDIDGLSIDLKTGNVCWRNAKKNRVEKIDSNGDNFEIMAEDITSKALWRVFSSALSDENMLSIR
jgi:DNA-binding beta-propeller fold protein YncE